MLVPVFVYQLDAHGRHLVSADFIPAECHACGGTRRFTAQHPGVTVTVACPFCRRPS